MPSPARYKNTEEGYKNYMKECMHQNLHLEKEQKEKAVAKCLNMWRKEHGPRHPGKAQKKKVADLVRQIAQDLTV